MEEGFMILEETLIDERVEGHAEGIAKGFILRLEESKETLFCI